MAVIRDTSRRRREISALVRERGSVQVTTLAERYSVSMQTVRKDLHFLAKKGIAERSYGGAISADAVNVATEPPVESKRAINVEEKARIGAVAAAMVVPGDSVVLDSGTTTLQIAYHLPDDESITVLTNDLDILWALARKERINVVMLGGALRRAQPGALRRPDRERTHRPARRQIVSRDRRVRYRTRDHHPFRAGSDAQPKDGESRRADHSRRRPVEVRQGLPSSHPERRGNPRPRHRRTRSRRLAGCGRRLGFRLHLA